MSIETEPYTILAAGMPGRPGGDEAPPDAEEAEEDDDTEDDSGA